MKTKHFLSFCLLTIMMLWAGNASAVDYLCFTANGTTSKITLQKQGSPTYTPSLLYSTNGTSWSTYTIGSEKTISAGSKIYFRANGTNYGFSNDNGSYYRFVMTGNFSVSGDLTTLLSSNGNVEDLSQLTTNRIFNNLFYSCTALTDASGLVLPSTKLVNHCYQSMFYGCTALKNGPKVLPARVLSEYCYSDMFEACSALVTGPVLPATTLAPYCYYDMFARCTSLVAAPDLPATKPAMYCYNFMFYGCTSLKKVSVNFTTWTCSDNNNSFTMNWMDNVPAGLVFSCPSSLSTTSGTTNMNLPSSFTKISPYLCFTANEAGSEVALTKTGAPTNVALYYSWNGSSWYSYTIGDSKKLNTVGSTIYFRAQNTNSTFSESSSNYYSFSLSGSVAASGSIMSLLSSSLSATSVPDYCFYRLFYGCSVLTSAPSLPAKTVGSYAYNNMFNNCTQLFAAPELNATQVGQYSYGGMFNGCINLTSAPSTLPATDLSSSNNCYAAMFFNCTNLRNAPALPSTNLSDYCYYNMFYKCENITAAPTLSAQTLAKGCYRDMFSGCTNLTAAPKLPATTLTTECYYRMFNGCSNLKKVEANFTSWYSGATSSWLYGTASEGLFLCPDELATTRGTSNIPSTWTVNPLTFTANNGSSTVKLNKVGSPTALTGLQYSTNGLDWYNYTPGTTSAIGLANAGDKVYFRATSTNSTFCASTSAYYKFEMSGSIAASGNIMSLLDKTCVQTSLPQGAFAMLFNECSTLTSAPKLPSTTLATDCYRGMFLGCSALTKTPALPATTLADFCYQNMFTGCTKLTTAPTLPATTLANNCYAFMFDGCTKLTTAPALPAMTAAHSCYRYMFQNCTSLTAAPALPATTLANYCYKKMFKGCTSLTKAPALPAKTLVSYCYDSLFYGCSKLNEITVAFTSWTSSTTTNWVYGVASTGYFFCPPTLARTTGVSYIPSGWASTFDYLTFTAKAANSTVSLGKTGSPTAVSLQTSRDGITWTDYVPGTTGNITLANVNDYVYFRATSANSTFSKSESSYYNFALTGSIAASGNIMSLLDKTCNKTSVPAHAFDHLFYNSANSSVLIRAPKLPATTVGAGGYHWMFNYCTGLTEAPELPATALGDSCYRLMFNYCSGLTKAPELPATTLAKACYRALFQHCTGLTEVPELPSTTLTEGCYAYMFYNCSKIEKAPILPAKVLTTECYYQMFNKCAKLNEVTVAFTSWTSNATTNWLNSVASTGHFYCPPTLVKTTGVSNIPSGWTSGYEYLTFVANTADSKVALTKTGSPTAVSLETSTDGCTWTDYVPGETGYITLTKANDYVYFRAGRADGNSSFSKDLSNYYKFDMSGSIAASGNIMSLVDATCESKTIPNSYAFYDLFFNQTALTSAPKLPATTLTSNCYYYMFNGCSALTVAPELPATTLTSYCYYYMFQNCTSLTAAPELKAENAPQYCYSGMFKGCIKLTEAPELKAKTMQQGCYSSMFYNCTSLTVAPELPATKLAPYCYSNMFNSCTSLTVAPELAVTTLDNYCYSNMFNGCKNLEYVPLLRAETLATACYNQMFYNCSKLDVVRTEMTNASATNATSNWLYGTKASGTLVCPSTLANADSYKPSNWDVKTYAKTVKLNAKGYSTYSSPVPVAITSGADAYSCAVDFGEHTITCSQNPNNNIMPGQGYLLANEDAPSTTVTFHQIEGIIADDMADVENSLLPTTTWNYDVVPMPTGVRCYSLSGSTFMHFAGSSFVANKAYFMAPLAVGAAEMRIIFAGAEEEGDALAIDAIEDDTKQDGRSYDLLGRPIKGNDVKGIMVRNGKTIVVKR